MNPSVAALGALGALPLEAACHSTLAIQTCMRAHHGGLVVLAEGVRGVAREELEHSCANTRRWDVRTRTGRIARVTATHCPRRLTPRVPAGRAPRRDRTPNEAVC